jgi:hypothetical protein
MFLFTRFLRNKIQLHVRGCGLLRLSQPRSESNIIPHVELRMEAPDFISGAIAMGNGPMGCGSMLQSAIKIKGQLGGECGSPQSQMVIRL